MSEIVELSKPMKYTGAEGEVEATFITLIEPTGKVSHICCELESIIQSAIIRMSETFGNDIMNAAREQAQDAPKQNDRLDAESALSMMTAAGVDMQKVVTHFRELFKTVALMGGEKPLTAPRMDDLSHRDMRKLIGTYVGNFILS